MILLIAILIGLQVAEILCFAAYVWFRPDRSIRQAEKEKHEFLTGAAMKILNRGWGVQGAPPMDNEFEEPEPVKEPEKPWEELSLDEQKAQLIRNENLLFEMSQSPRQEGSIAKRRRLVGETARLRQHLEEQAVQLPNPGELGMEDLQHLEGLRG